MAFGAKNSGLNAFLGEFLDENKFIAGLNRHMILLMSMIIVGVVTSVASNTATALILVPVLLSLSERKNIHPGFLILAPTISASYAFMFPVSTPPNTIVYDAGGLSQLDIFKPGLPITLITNAVLYGCVVLFLDPLYGFKDYDNYCEKKMNITGRSSGARFLGRSSVSVLAMILNDGNANWDI